MYAISIHIVAVLGRNVCSQHTPFRKSVKCEEIPSYAPEHPLFPARTRHPMSSRTKGKHARRALAVEGTTGAWGVTVNRLRRRQGIQGRSSTDGNGKPL